MDTHKNHTTEHQHCHHAKEKKIDQGNKHNEHQGHCGGMGGMHSAHHGVMIQDFKRRFWVSLIITLPILTLSPMIQDFLRFRLVVPGNTYILFLLSTVIYFYGGWPFIKGLYEECRDKNPGMMTLIGIAISVAYFYVVRWDGNNTLAFRRTL